MTELLDFHNFVLEKYLGAAPVSFAQVCDEAFALAPKLKPLVADIPQVLAQLQAAGKHILFEGAQGALLDVDHGTYPFVTSSNTLAGAAAAGAGVGPQALHYVLGISKAYTTRVGSGPFPTELDDAVGERLRTRGNEFGSVTGRPRRCGWFDGVALKRSVQLNGVSGLCVTKLDVLDGMDVIRLCSGYLVDGEVSDRLPVGADDLARCVPIYEDFPGWSATTFGVKTLAGLPGEARRYLDRLSEVSGAPIDMISTGPDRDETILSRHPYH